MGRDESTDRNCSFRFNINCIGGAVCLPDSRLILEET
jgi:hypothetical protein